MALLRVALGVVLPAVPLDTTVGATTEGDDGTSPLFLDAFERKERPDTEEAAGDRPSAIVKDQIVNK